MFFYVYQDCEKPNFAKCKRNPHKSCKEHNKQVVVFFTRTTYGSGFLITGQARKGPEDDANQNERQRHARSFPCILSRALG